VRWSRKQARQDIDAAAEVRRSAEAAEADAHERVRLPMRELRETNHIAADIARLLRGRDHGESGATAH
jgi:hypothetical protein